MGIHVIAFENFSLTDCKTNFKAVVIRIIYFFCNPKQKKNKKPVNNWKSEIADFLEQAKQRIFPLIGTIFIYFFKLNI